MKRATSPPELLIPLLREDDSPLRLQVERGLRQAIQTGRMPAGALLPSTRALAADLGVSRGVVLSAYEQLLAEGYVEAHRGSATRVALCRPASDPAISEQSVRPRAYRYDFRPGVPDLSLFPRRRWLASVRRAIGGVASLAFDYPDSRGVESSRAALAEYLNRVRATTTGPDRILLCTGFSQGIRLVCEVLRDRGVCRIAVEDPGHLEVWDAIEAVGLEKVCIPVDDDGLRTDLLEGSRAGAVLVTPAHQFPTGAVLAPERRAALLDWASRRRAFIVEDDYDAEYRYDREPIGSLQGRAPDHVIYIGTASKTLAPALRLGWVVLPQRLVDDVVLAKRRADHSSPVFDHLAFADFIDRGELDRHLRRTRSIYRRRRDLLVASLETRMPRLKLRGIAAGLHMMVELAPGADEEKVVAAAAQRSIRLFALRAYRADPEHGRPALLLGYGGLRDNVIDEAVERLAIVLRDQRPKGGRPRHA